ncbi:hypothetical protein ACFWPU_00995 [Streptomyces sp. NPDC058471]|uniref:hypothetical protein n=1 Tax=Streptomyces sp. NPDC058471 TaxID=3346516 RepID=UPI003657ADD5
MSDNTPNIVHGRVTRHATNSQRRTPNWLKAVYAVVAAFVVIMAVAMIVGQPEPDAGRHSIPLCKTEDGKDHRVCFWDAQKQGNGEGRSFTSYNFGEYVVYNDTLNVSPTDTRNPEKVFK